MRVFKQRRIWKPDLVFEITGAGNYGAVGLKAVLT